MVFKGQYDWEWGGLEGALCNGFNHLLQSDEEKQGKVTLSAANGGERHAGFQLNDGATVGIWDVKTLLGRDESEAMRSGDGSWDGDHRRSQVGTLKEISDVMVKP